MHNRTRMKNQSRAGAGIIAAVCMFLSLGSPGYTQAQKEKVVTTHATGPFEVKLAPQPADGSPIGRMTSDKQFHGDLEATSKGQMLAFSSDVKGSAGYVAMEQVTGKLHGRNGSFVLQHTGTMNRGVPELSITVVPDSGAGELVGLTGKMAINVVDGKHSYEFDYTLSTTP
jgi:Protein of unknown function (DUF3224)